MEIRKQRGKVECFFERQPGGCKKPHCPFLHKSPLKATNEDGSELVSESADIHSAPSDNLTSIKSSPFQPDQEFKGEGDISTALLSNINENLKSCVSPPFSPTSKQPGSPSSTAATIGSEPVSFNIDIAEESENEPEEVGSLEKKPIKLTASNSQSGKNFGVKTLEQIRMEKVFKSNDVNKESPPEPPNTSSKVSRIKLKRKTLCTTNNAKATNDGSPGLNENESKPGNLGFGVKSLEEIRREKEQARQTPEQVPTETQCSDVMPKKIIRIKRTHLGTSKPDEPPSKIVKLRKPVSEESTIAIKPVTKYNLIQSTDNPAKVQSSENPTQRLQSKTLSTPPLPIKSTIPMPSLQKLGPAASPVSSSLVSSTPIVAVSPQKQSQPNRVSIKPEIHKLKKSVSKQANEIEKLNLGGKGLKTQTREQKSSSSIKKHDIMSSAMTDMPTTNTLESQPLKKSKLSSSPSHDKSEWNEELSEKASGDEVNSLQKDEDFLEDDLLDDENGETAPEGVNIEDEDDEFLKEIEHVINS